MSAVLLLKSISDNSNDATALNNPLPRFERDWEDSVARAMLNLDGRQR